MTVPNKPPTATPSDQPAKATASAQPAQATAPAQAAKATAPAQPQPAHKLGPVSALIVASDAESNEAAAAGITLAKLLNLAYKVADPAEFAQANNIRPPWPKVVITVGEETGFVVPLLRRQSPYTFFIHIGNPNRPLRDFDVVLAPEHDLPRGYLRYSHVLRYQIGLSRIVPRLANQLRQSHGARKLRMELPGTRLTAIIGAESSVYKFSALTATHLARRLVRTANAENAALLVATTPDTPASVAAVFKRRVQGERFRFRACKTLDEYGDFLGAATHLATTWESPARLADACSMRQALYMLPLPRRLFSKWVGRYRNMNKAHQHLVDQRHALVFTGKLSSFVPNPLQEMQRVSALVRDRLEPRMAVIRRSV